MGLYAFSVAPRIMTPEPNSENYRRANEQAWDHMARNEHRLARPARQTDLQNPLAAVDAAGWLGDDIRGRTVLCLAAGGGRQGPLYAAAGGIVTVVDISETMLERDRAVAEELNYTVRTVKASMDRLTGIADDSFDIVIHPVSTCYVPDIVAVFAEVARVIRAGGIYISQHKTPTSLQTGLKPTSESRAGYPIVHEYYSREPLPPAKEANLIREPGTYEYVHRWEQIVGGMCGTGFVIEDLTEPTHAADEAPGSFGHRSKFVAPYVRIKARRMGKSAPQLVL